jgi:hypothetical protein
MIIMKKIIVLLTLLAAFIYQGCAPTPELKSDLEKRVNALMTAKVNGDWALVYTFFDENFRAKTPKSLFETPKDVQFSDYQIEEIQMDPSGKKALVRIKHSMGVGGLTVDNIIDKQDWIVENNDWFLAAKPILGAISE